MKLTRKQLSALIRETVQGGFDFDAALDAVMSDLQQTNKDVEHAHELAPQGPAKAIVAGIHSDILNKSGEVRGYVGQLKRMGRQSIKESMQSVAEKRAWRYSEKAEELTDTAQGRAAMKTTVKRLKQIIQQEAKKKDPVADYNTRVRASHERDVDQILVLRPDWNRDALLAVGHTWGGSEDPGYHEILQALKAVMNFEKRFGSR